MNERILELIEQATEWAKQANWSTDPRFGDRRYEDLYNERLVELIVQECMELNRQELSFSAYARMADRYDEHFGIETDD